MFIVLAGESRCSGSGGGYAAHVTQVVLQIPEGTPVALGVSPERVGDALVLAAAVQWFESGRLSSGAAAELAGLSKPVFLERLKEFGVPAFRQTPEELRVVSEGRTLGTLPAEVTLREGATIIFSGRRWRVALVDVERKVLEVKPDPGGQPPCHTLERGDRQRQTQR